MFKRGVLYIRTIRKLMTLNNIIKKYPELLKTYKNDTIHITYLNEKIAKAIEILDVPDTFSRFTKSE